MERKSVAWRWTPALLGLLAYLLLTLVYLRPIWRVGGDHIAPDRGDPIFNLWVLSWGAHQARTGFPSFWDANIFHPLRGVLTFSDHLLGPAVQLALFEQVVPNPIAGYNLLFFTSFVASAFATAWVLRRSGRSWTAALLAGWMFAFAPFRLMHLNHIQILIAQWIPLTLWFWDRLLAERTAKAAALFLLFYLLHVTSGCYLAYMVHVPLLAVLLVRLREHGRALVAPQALRVLLPVGLVAGGAVAALFLPYVKVSQRLSIARTPAEAAAYAATTASWVSPAPQSRYAVNAHRAKILRRRLGPVAGSFFRTESSLFPGFLLSFFALAGLWIWRRERRANGDRPAPWRRIAGGALLAVALAAWLWGDLLTLTAPARRALLLGGLGRFGWTAPALVLTAALAAWWALRHRAAAPAREGDVWLRGVGLGGLLCFALAHPIAYVPLMQVVPGLDGMRVPSRFAALVTLALAVFAALGIDRLLERLRSRTLHTAAAAALALLLAWELAPKPVRWVPLPRREQFPAVYHWLKDRDDVQALLELPIRRNVRETTAMYFSTLHWKPLANGFSGYEPPTHEEIVHRMRWVPDRDGLAFLRSLGISHLLLHRAEILDDEPGPRLLARFEQDLAAGPAPEVELVWSGGEDRVYRILPSSRTPNHAGR